MEVVNLVRTASAQMAGLSQAPALPVPEAPKLRESNSPFAINWMGSPSGVITMWRERLSHTARGPALVRISLTAKMSGIRQKWISSVMTIAA